MQGRPRRSVLYMPGSNERALEKAKTLSADALILDLEDAVAPDEKLRAREQVCAAVKGGGYGAREVVIRVNALETPWGTEDILAATVVRERDSARRDRLTRLWNSRYLHEAVELEIARCRRYGRPFGLLLIDLDGFKAVNDTAGHLAGDQVLQVVGRVLRENCRATDFPARLGGDEFAVILPEASPEMVDRYAAKLVGLVGAAPFPPELPPITASIGGVAFRDAPASAKAAIAAADHAMYAAKRAGKNRSIVEARR